MCDSVISRVKSGKASARRQFVVYDRIQAYPQFVVALKYAGTNSVEKEAQEDHHEEQSTEHEENEDEDKTGNDASEQAEDD